MKKLIYLVACLFLAGCAGTKWSHSSNNENDFYRDRAMCSNEANLVTPNTAAPYNPYLTPMQQANQSNYNAGANFGRAVSLQTYFENCMISRGYYKQ